MEVFYPGFFHDFRCIASACLDSCCKEWEVDVDDVAAERYRSLEGPLGDRLRQVMKDTEDGVILTIASDTFAKGVYVDFTDCDPELSSNFFDLVNGEPYCVTVRSDRTAEELKKSLTLKTVYDIGR